MKKYLFLLLVSVALSGCSNFITQSQPTPERTIEPSPSALTSSEPALDGNIHNILVRDNNFGTEEITALKDEVLILSIRNQQEAPINVVIDELRIKSEAIEFGEAIEITIPTNQPGEYEMYSNMGNQRNEGLSALIIIDEGSEEDL